MIKNISNFFCFLLLFSNACLAGSNLPKQCPSAAQLKNKHFEFTIFSDRTYSIIIGDGFDYFGTDFKWDINFSSWSSDLVLFTVQAKDEYEAQKVFDNLFSQIKEPILLRDSKTVQCIYQTTPPYFFTAIYEDTSLDLY